MGVNTPYESKRVFWRQGSRCISGLIPLTIGKWRWRHPSHQNLWRFEEYSKISSWCVVVQPAKSETLCFMLFPGCNVAEKEEIAKFGPFGPLVFGSKHMLVLILLRQLHHGSLLSYGGWAVDGRKTMELRKFKNRMLLKAPLPGSNQQKASFPTFWGAKTPCLYMAFWYYSLK